MKHFGKDVFDNIKIASPCNENWNEMFGDQQTRFCGNCEMNVYNISEMSRKEAERLIYKQEGRLCVRLYRRHDGTIITKDCPVGLKALKRRLGKIATAVASLVITIIGGIGFVNLANSTFNRTEDVVGEQSSKIGELGEKRKSVSVKEKRIEVMGGIG